MLRNSITPHCHALALWLAKKYDAGILWAALFKRLEHFEAPQFAVEPATPRQREIVRKLADDMGKLYDQAAGELQREG